LLSLTNSFGIEILFCIMNSIISVSRLSKRDSLSGMVFGSLIKRKLHFSRQSPRYVLIIMLLKWIKFKVRSYSLSERSFIISSSYSFEGLTKSMRHGSYGFSKDLSSTYLWIYFYFISIFFSKFFFLSSMNYCAIYSVKMILPFSMVAPIPLNFPLKL
jgi:hypothetical protein